MQVGTKVIRKSDLRVPCTAFGILESIRGTKATVQWTYNGRQQHSTLALSSLVEVTVEMEQDIRAKTKARYEAMKAEEDRKRIYLCNNVNPRARGSMYGHPKPLPLMESQVVDGKCFYCGYPVQKREGAKV